MHSEGGIHRQQQRQALGEIVMPRHPSVKHRQTLEEIEFEKREWRKDKLVIVVPPIQQGV